MSTSATCYFFDRALLPDGWAERVRISVTPQGDIASVDKQTECDASTRISGAAIPGMPNLHSHAFQRGLAGRAEFQSGPADSFWTWRELMYAFTGQLTPEQLHAIAAQLYLEMLKAGYTSVAEFHYLHHDISGQPYADPSEMSGSIIQAALDTGIGLTHLPVLYISSDFGGKPPSPGQRRFIHTPESYLRLFDAVQTLCRPHHQLSSGLALHSLRAVPPVALQQVVAAHYASDANAPVHIHIAEQVREVQECIKATGQRPVEWLLDHAEVDQRWNLVHATHLSDEERSRLARCGAVAGLCPTTEANLGDGLFPLEPYMHESGRFGIGSDSNSSVSPVEELRWLEYGQRLALRRRNIAASDAQPHTGQNLWLSACSGGAQASGRQTGSLRPGNRADIIVLQTSHPSLVGCQREHLLDSFVFTGNSNPVSDVIAGGQHLVHNGHHADEEAITARFCHVMENSTAG